MIVVQENQKDIFSYFLYNNIFKYVKKFIIKMEVEH